MSSGSSDLVIAYLLHNFGNRGIRVYREVDHLLAMNFKWWDLIVENKKPISLSDLNI